MKNILATALSLILIMSSVCVIIPASAKQPVPNNQITEKYITFNGISVYTEAYNYSPKKKDAIVYLHGLGGGHADAEFLYDPSNTRMTISFDMIGHGNTGDLPITWENCIGVIKAVIDAYDIKNVDFVAHSAGADMAMMFAKEYNNRVKNIVLIDRAYYNYSEMEQYNFTKEFTKVVEFNPAAGYTYEQFSAYLDMLFANDITSTWDIKKDVLLIAANPYWAAPVDGQPCIVDIIAMIKQFPEMFGFSPEQAQMLPDITMENLYDYMAFLESSVNGFESMNKKFSVIKTPYEHSMVFNEIAQVDLLNYSLEYIENGDKSLAKEKIKKLVDETFNAKANKNAVITPAFEDIYNSIKN